jgi:hypothetical protein
MALEGVEMEQGQFETLLILAISYLESAGANATGIKSGLDRALILAKDASMKEAETTIERLRVAYKLPPRPPMKVWS